MTIFAGLVGGWLTPMFGERADIGLFSSVLIAVLIIGYAVGMLLLRRIIDPGPLARGEARWRYRSRGLRDRIQRARTSLAPFDRTTGWWAVRSEFAAASLAVTAATLEGVRSAGVRSGGLPSPGVAMLLTAAGVGGVLVGLGWMVRIYRAPLRVDSTAYWRYRDGV